MPTHALVVKTKRMIPAVNPRPPSPASRVPLANECWVAKDHRLIRGGSGEQTEKSVGMAVTIGLLFPILILWGRSTGNLLWDRELRPPYLTGRAGETLFMVFATIILLSPISGLAWIFLTFSFMSALVIVISGVVIGFITFSLCCIIVEHGARFALCALLLLGLHLVAWGVFHP